MKAYWKKQMEVSGQLHTLGTLQPTHTIMGLTQNDDKKEMTDLREVQV